ncbi:hypothetical protein AWV79_31155 [Cupriavidus sp. UYMMa02A]|nr:hypothetical protein AWV79_31155 [Cupriavidus sp. UYMMa02A]
MFWRKAWLCPLVLACLCGSAMADAPQAAKTPAMIPDKAASLVRLSVTLAGERLVSAGERGVILLSDDNGKTWRQAKVPVSAALTRVRFVDSRNGWAVGHGGVVLATRDAGETWQKQLDGAAAAQLELAAARREDGDESRRLATHGDWCKKVRTNRSWMCISPMRGTAWSSVRMVLRSAPTTVARRGSP